MYWLNLWARNHTCISLNKLIRRIKTQKNVSNFWKRSNHDKFNFPDACFCEQCFQVTKTSVISARTEKSKRLLSLAVDFLNLENGITFSVSSCSNTVICFLPVLKGRNTSLCFNPFVLMMAFLLWETAVKKYPMVVWMCPLMGHILTDHTLTFCCLLW